MKETAPDPPKTAYRIRFLPMDETVEVDPANLPDRVAGHPGSILQTALDAGISIGYACGGVCACSTCHIIVQEGVESIPDGTDSEVDMLEKAPGLQLDSRLACQAVPDGSCDLVVEVPSWNRNLVQEDHG
ncbi:MAG: 2Fe-2S iron-sulfur cluster-binding protein [Planctomycetota bacterium]|nr:2Fe-2S iron-sulfur cluster-binding protein [Planctomycetota bacterium]MDP6942334.1 2Fe-2S iron-sulfur cluster-binding protein [Planctomycetota bacterium]